MLKLFGDVTLGYELDGTALAIAARADRLQRPAAGALRVLCARKSGGITLPKSIVARITHWLRMLHWRLARSRLFDKAAIRAACECSDNFDRADLWYEGLGHLSREKAREKLWDRCFGSNTGTLHRPPDSPRCSNGKIEMQTQLSVLALVRLDAGAIADGPQEMSDFVKLYGFAMAGPSSAHVVHYTWDDAEDRPRLREAVVGIQPKRDETARRAAIRKDAEPMVQSVLNSPQLPLRAVSYDGLDLQPSPVFIDDAFFDVDPAVTARLRGFVMRHNLPLATELADVAGAKRPTKWFSRTAWPLPDPTFILTAAIESDDCASPERVNALNLPERSKSGRTRRRGAAITPTAPLHCPRAPALVTASAVFNFAPFASLAYRHGTTPPSWAEPR